VPLELTIIAVTALMAGLLLVGVMLAGRGEVGLLDGSRELVAPGTPAIGERENPGPDQTLRVAWWLTITIVLLGVGISGSFGAEQAPIFALGGLAVLAVLVFHEMPWSRPGRLPARAAELVTAVGVVAGLLALTGFASSPFAMLFALVAVAAALGFGPRAGIAAAVLATMAFGVILMLDPALTSYTAADVLRLSFGVGATWLLAFVSIAHADRQRRAIRRAIDLSRTDPLTGLFNRSQLYETLEQEVSRTRRSGRGFCVLMIDLDGLKSVNDTAGHLRGDQVLGGLGRVIHGSIRTVDSAYRYGGDEFVVLLPETDIVGAFVVAEKIRLGAEGLEATVGPQTSVSIGLVSHPEDGVSAEELMVAADRAMYEAKSLGKNQISGNPRPRPALLARRSTLEPSQAPISEASAVAVGPSVVEEAPPIAAAPAEPEPRDVAIPLGHASSSPPAGSPGPANGASEIDDTEPDPQEVRRRIATASRSFDPDHQVRRAMDAFFSPGLPPSSDPEQSRPEH
jgi:diguanylate cyclase (GGDEF)-like protein